MELENSNIKHFCTKEICDYNKKQKLTMAEVDFVWKCTDILKNFAKIDKLEGNSEIGHSRMSYDSSYDDDYSERRGRGRGARRDRLGRYSSEDGSSYDEYSEDGMSERYSRHSVKDGMMRKLGALMEDAEPKEREVLKECMRALERA